MTHEDEYDALARELHEAIAAGQSVTLTAKALRFLVPNTDAVRQSLDVEAEARALGEAGVVDDGLHAREIVRDLHAEGYRIARLTAKDADR